MNKALQIILLVLTIITIKSEFQICGSVNNFENIKSSDRDDYCRVFSTSTDKTHCCYFEYDDVALCKEISDDAYENIKRYKTFWKNNHSNVKIKCSSEYLAYSLFALLALLI